MLNPDLPDVWNDKSVTLNIGHEMALSKTPRSPCTKKWTIGNTFFMHPPVAEIADGRRRKA